VLIVLAATASGATWGVARWWASLPVVQVSSWLR
jgi:thiosulfate dehydrogenase [quinone] large subunit